MKTAALRILYVAYPMLPVSESSCGGAEQMLWALEAEMARRGHRTTVAACHGSRVSGKLLATGTAPAEVDAFAAREDEHHAAVLQFLSETQSSPRRFDLVHDKGGSFWRRAAEVDAPVLATLHLPRSFYPPDAFHAPAPNLFFNCVSESQRQTFAGVPRVVGAIANGIRLEYFPPAPVARHHYLLWLGRICPEKGTDIAIEVARRAGATLVLAGDVYPFSSHQEYFRRAVRPHLQDRHSRVRYVGVPRFTEKLLLLRRARGLLVPSLAEETSSLVGMEAMACGTPVVAFGRGALPEVVRDGVTGFVVDSVEAMVGALGRLQDIDGARARRHVEEHFSAVRMAADYELLYRRVVQTYAGRSTLAAA